MEPNIRIRGQNQKHHFLKHATLILLILGLLTGCNFPQPSSTLPTLSHQQQTEISGILNPSGLETSEPIPTETYSTPVPTIIITPEETVIDGYINYQTQQGDTLAVLAKRFNVDEDTIISSTQTTSENFLPVGTLLHIPSNLEGYLPMENPIFPDSEVLYGPSVGDFDTIAYIEAAGGFLASYEEEVKEKTLTGPEIVHWVALETSTNPRLLLAFLEYQSGWVFGFPPGAEDDPYPIGFGATLDTGLYKELMITARVLAQGFYGWRDGSRLWLSFYGGETVRLAPELNPGSTALMALFASIYPPEVWETHLYDEDSFLNFYLEMFGDYLSRAAEVEPYLLHTTQQPELMLPFAPGEEWSFTGGPHITWQTGTPKGAVDFAPISGEGPCMTSAWWATAAAPGLIVRSERNVVAIDLDGDGDEGTGWVLIYMHIAEQDRPFVGLQVERDDPVGHPSCEGGNSTGTHVHFARKFNGEWVAVDEPLPMVLSGWRVFAGDRRYEGYMQKGVEIVTAVPYGSSDAKIVRDE